MECELSQAVKKAQEAVTPPCPWRVPQDSPSGALGAGAREPATGLTVCALFVRPSSHSSHTSPSSDPSPERGGPACHRGRRVPASRCRELTAWSSVNMTSESRFGTGEAVGDHCDLDTLSCFSLVQPGGRGQREGLGPAGGGAVCVSGCFCSCGGRRCQAGGITCRAPCKAQPGMHGLHGLHGPEFLPPSQQRRPGEATSVSRAPLLHPHSALPPHPRSVPSPVPRSFATAAQGSKSSRVHLPPFPGPAPRDTRPRAVSPSPNGSTTASVAHRPSSALPRLTPGSPHLRPFPGPPFGLLTVPYRATSVPRIKFPPEGMAYAG